MRIADSLSPGRLLAVASLLFVAGATLTPIVAIDSPDATPLWCLVCGRQGLVDVLGNVALFLPLGMSLRILRYPKSRAMVAVLATTLTVEGLQLAVIQGRDGSLSDLITNSFGGWLGYSVALRTPVLILAPPRTARTLAAAVATVWLGQTGASLEAFRPITPDTDVYWGQWAHRFPNWAPFRGTVLRAEVDAIRVTDGPHPNTAGLKMALGALPTTVTITAVGGSSVDGRAQLFAVVDGGDGSITGINQRHCTFWFSPNVRAAQWRLNAPDVAVTPPCRRARDDTLVVAGRFTAKALALSVQSGDRTWESELPLGPNLGWSLFSPTIFQLRPNSPAFWAWIVLWALPLTYWTGRGWGTGSGVMGVAALAVLGWIIFPAIWGRSIPDLAEWVALLLSSVTGFTAGRWTSSRPIRRRQREARPACCAPTAAATAAHPTGVRSVADSRRM